MNLAVVVPTVPGRESLLDACLRSVYTTAPEAAVFVVEQSPSCGEGWQHGGDSAIKAGAEYVMLAADDLEFQAGWWQAAIEKLEQRQLPSPVVLNADGSLQSSGGFWDSFHDDGEPTHGAITPFLNRELWEAVQPVAPFPHYCDVWISERAVQAGYQPVVCDAFRFVHKVTTPISNEETQAWEQWRAAR